MSPLSPKELLELLKATRDGVGLPLDADNIAAAAKLMLDKIVEIGRDETGKLRVRLIEKH